MSFGVVCVVDGGPVLGAVGAGPADHVERRTAGGGGGEVDGSHLVAAFLMVVAMSRIRE